MLRAVFLGRTSRPQTQLAVQQFHTSALLRWNEAAKRKLKPKTSSLTQQRIRSSPELLDSMIPWNTVIPIQQNQENEAGNTAASDTAAKKQKKATASAPAATPQQPSQQPWTSFDDMPLLQSIKQALSVQNFTYEVKAPSVIQQVAVPALLKRQDVLLASETGSGKTLAYLMPLIHKLKLEEEKAAAAAKGAKSETAAAEGEEEEEAVKRLPNRPRMIIVVPTRELASQVISVVKQLTHHCKLSSCVLRSDMPLKQMKDALNRPIDIVVSTPKTLIDLHSDPKFVDQKLEETSPRRLLYFSEVKYLVLDEADTLLGKGFKDEVLNGIILPIKQRTLKSPLMRTQFVFVEATHQKQMEQFLQEHFPNIKRLSAGARQLHTKLPNVKHKFVHCIQAKMDKLEALVKLLKNETSAKRIIIFCNTIASCRAVDYCLSENGFKVASFHGEIPAEKQRQNFESFKSGEVPILISTDIASRGLDILDVNHVVNFDFPMNVIDYVHRAGRTGRMGTRGVVTSLVKKKDQVLAEAIQLSIDKGTPMNMITPDAKLNKDLVPSLVRKVRSKRSLKMASIKAAAAPSSQARKKPLVGTRGKRMNRRGLNSTVGRSKQGFARRQPSPAKAEQNTK